MTNEKQWPITAFRPNARVKVIKDSDWDGPWKNEFFGTIDDSPGPPEPVASGRGLPGELRYWVRFDEPQYDYNGDGPYRKAQIWDRYLIVE